MCREWEREKKNNFANKNAMDHWLLEKEVNIMFILIICGRVYTDILLRCVCVPIYVQLINGKNVSLDKHRQ